MRPKIRTAFLRLSLLTGTLALAAVTAAAGPDRKLLI
jgi:hypothetical protein